jgi:hypothetical protein
MKRISRLNLICSILPLTLTLGMGSCTTTVEEACRDRFPELKKELVEATEQIANQVAMAMPEHNQNRAIASVSSNDTASLNRGFSLSREQKDQWQDWVEARLVESERFLDFARTRTELTQAREPLAELTKEFVAFDGYVERGQLYRMAESLQHIQDRADTAARLGCESVLSGK